MTKLYTVGYDSLTIERLTGRLKDAGVSHVVDIRLSPNSRNPVYRKAALEAAIKRSGLRYTHLESLGNLNYKGGAAALKDPAAGLPALEGLIRDEHGSVAILCVCPRPAECHRRLVTDTLLSVGAGITEVIDL